MNVAQTERFILRVYHYIMNFQFGIVLHAKQDVENLLTKSEKNTMLSQEENM